MSPWSWLTSLVERGYVARVNARFAALERAEATVAARCELCSGVAIYRCPICREPIHLHTHEVDYMYVCDEHGFINPIRERHDGQQ